MSKTVNHPFRNYANVFNFTVTQHHSLTSHWQFLCTKPSLIHSQASPSGPGELRLSVGLMAVSRNVDALTCKRCCRSAAAVRLSAQSDMTPRCQGGKALMVPCHSNCCKDFVMSKWAHIFPEKTTHFLQ